MRRPEAWNVARMHAVTAVEAQKIWHAGAIKMGPRGLRIFSHIDIRFHNVARRGHVITEFTRHVILVLLDHAIVPWRRIETSFAGGNGAYPNDVFTLVEIGALLRNLHHNFRAAGNAVTPPKATGGRPARQEARKSLWRELFTTRERQCCGYREEYYPAANGFHLFANVVSHGRIK